MISFKVLSDEQVSPFWLALGLTFHPWYEERAWYDNHRASLAPEVDADTVLDDIRSGAPPPRGRDRGLTASHLKTFLDPTIWKTFEGDSENVLCSLPTTP